MHKLAEKIADCMKAKVEAKGIDNIEGQDLVELGMWTDIIKDLVCYDKDKKIIEAMDEAEESEEAMKYIEMYEDYPRKGYRGQRRDSRGRYMSNRGRRGYEMPMMIYEEDWDEMERMRDMDRMSHGRMGYSGSGYSNGGQYSSGMSGSSSSMDSGQSNSGSMSNTRGYSESRYDRAKRGYEESKAMHKDNTPESKQHKMKSLEEYTKELAEDITTMVHDMSAEEKNLVRGKLQTLAQKIS